MKKISGQTRIPPDCRRPFLIAGPCVLEGESMAMHVAETVAKIAQKHGLFYIFKASYLKDNRTSGASYTGPLMAEGLRILSKVKSEFSLPVITDVHFREGLDEIADCVDFLQIPAFLCRQGSLLHACASTGLPLNIKKGQFLAPADMALAVGKVREDNPEAEVLLTERGTAFGYRDLVVDMRGIALMRSMGCRVVFDVTHSLQHPGKGGDRRFLPALSRSALAAGAEGLFIETHPDPVNARCDASTQLQITEIEPLIAQWAHLGSLIADLESSDLPLTPSSWPGLEISGH